MYYPTSSSVGVPQIDNGWAEDIFGSYTQEILAGQVTTATISASFTASGTHFDDHATEIPLEYNANLPRTNKSAATALPAHLSAASVHKATRSRNTRA